MPQSWQAIRALLLAPLLLCGLLVIGCTKDSDQDARSPTSENEGPIRVVTTTGMIGDLVRAVGGEAVTVDNLIGEGVDPHLYKPTRDDITRLLNAQIIFFNGLHLEGRMGDVLKRTGRDRPTIAVAETIPSTDLLHPDGMTGYPDPHLWLSPLLWARCGTAVVSGLTKLNPEEGPTFESNHEKLIDECDRLEKMGRSAIASIPAKSRVLITSHDAFSYFGRAFDIEVMAIQGISTESEAGLADLEALVDLVVRRRIPAVFVESSVPRRSIEALIEGAAAQGHEVIIGGELFSDSMGPKNTPEGTWSGMLTHDIETVTRGLGGDLRPERKTEIEPSK